MITTQESRKQAIGILKSAEIAPSEPRIAVLSFLNDNPIHPNVDTVFTELVKTYPTLSRTTVYSALKLFTDKNIIQQINIENGELRYDATVQFHAHFKCTKCGCIIDIMDIPQPPPPPLSHHLNIQNTQLFYYGLCPQCEQYG